MDHVLFLILVSVAAALLGWVVTRGIVGGMTGGRRVSQRLSTDGRSFAEEQDHSAILVQSQQTAFSRALLRKGFFQRVQRQLMAVWPGMIVSRFVILSGVIATAALIITTIVFTSPIVPIGAAAAAGYAPFLLLSSRAAKRNKLLGEQLPEAMDFLARILRAGHSLTTGIQMMASELPEPLASEFRRCHEQPTLGQPLDECLKEMADRVQNTELSLFVTAVLIQRQTGGDLGMVLGNISSTIRSRMRLSGFVRAKTAEGRLTGYVLVGFPILMFCFASWVNPEYGGKLLHTPTGQKLLATAIGLQTAGLLAIKKLTNVRV